ncbi:MAG: Ribosomal RNA small subunit methyltransferase H [Candidatus Daviesbacteria bacterium GW2011_GWA1_41_61]|uniref:Ribosomal RNA small subunit methyltransferase H n=1 Tax=Candidatus Daviesbacteria bacterium GW2011_GWA2_40_9 TaxID=1618424 RepID=A0A0G0U1K9_9BACT|nr:MAG: Ribosomal RNA small subunit methyltransferase H [Candidatus Daviesbacteria bacterium GW2011_GWC1_40_9]KKR82994.1 MAG: Ribosomal RNA small subunit methyltransferase H [Candidatus Daviesbacteria bacterium GW2011_GWA2_40_9]KKR92920.1 MAG: Ribosomal RNA small subunit methyltransferase H [Candidatus Daviesbacteria bacterium GW2011_GWB1_41_15]KKS15464.1 MAG: Ribosomal RNA small subunit methyltransferase H [Candidatus Daviesbacteria bacterium GW2011_GWA1_41_61]
MNTYHIPVMLKETLQFLQVKPKAWYIDANLGGGGHTEGIIKARSKVLGIDLDPEAIREVAKNHHLEVKLINDHLQAISADLILYQSNFAHMGEVVKKLQLDKILGVLFDLGVSSHQLEKPQRGFSFNLEAPLDMRMDPQHMTVTAADLINALHENELTQLIQKYGEERYAKRIAKKIVEERKKQRIATTNHLAQIITSVRPKSKADRTHPATRTFQALRIAVNDELHSLKEALPQVLEVLSPGGRLVVISFHSLEDRIVKNFFKDENKKGSIKIITQKPLIPSEEEVKTNPRSRSGKLRVAEKL